MNDVGARNAPARTRIDWALYAALGGDGEFTTHSQSIRVGSTSALSIGHSHFPCKEYTDLLGSRLLFGSSILAGLYSVALATRPLIGYVFTIIFLSTATSFLPTRQCLLARFDLRLLYYYNFTVRSKLSIYTQSQSSSRPRTKTNSSFRVERSHLYHLHVRQTLPHNGLAMGK